MPAVLEAECFELFKAVSALTVLIAVFSLLLAVKVRFYDFVIEEKLSVFSDDSSKSLLGVAFKF